MYSRQQDKFVPERWDDDVAYESSHQWSYRRWAWEFLRRNVEYQAACNGASRARGADHTAQSATFGRVDLRPFWREYQPSDDRRSMWLAESVQIVGSIEWGIDEPSKPLKEGQVALIFDLTQTATSGKAAIRSMQAHADQLLRDALAEFSRSTKDFALKPRMYKPISKVLLARYLRLYDAIEIFRESTDATVSVLYPQYWDQDKQSIVDGRRQEAQKLISKNLMKAREMVSRTYKTLVPLDVARADEERKRSNNAIDDES